MVMYKKVIVTTLILGLAASQISGQCNTAPVVKGESVDAFRDEVWLDVLANDGDQDGNSLTVTSVSTTCAATVDVDNDVVVLTPSPVLTGDCQVDYTVSDGQDNATGRVVVRFASDIFSDSFETGTVEAWQ